MANLSDVLIDLYTDCNNMWADSDKLSETVSMEVATAVFSGRVSVSYAADSTTVSIGNVLAIVTFPDRLMVRTGARTYSGSVDEVLGKMKRSKFYPVVEQVVEFIKWV